MRLLLDNSIPVRFARIVAGHEVTHVRDLHWGQLLDGPLLSTIGSHYEALITVDRKMRYRQNIGGKAFFVVILRAKSK